MSTTQCVCVYCKTSLDDEERSNPRTTPDGEIVCDDCYHERFEFLCCLCECYGDIEDQHRLLVVFDAEEAFDSDARSSGYSAGLYRVVSYPYYTSDYFSAWLNEYNLERIGPIPRGASSDGYSCGHLCGPCQSKIAWPYEVIVPGEPVAWTDGRRSAISVVHSRTLRAANRVARSFGPEAIARRRNMLAPWGSGGFYDGA